MIFLSIAPVILEFPSGSLPAGVASPATRLQRLRQVGNHEKGACSLPFDDVPSGAIVYKLLGREIEYRERSFKTGLKPPIQRRLL